MVFQQKISKTFLSGQKSNFNFQNRGYFGQKKYSVNFFKLQSQLVYRKVIKHISAKIFKKFLSGQKSNFNFQNRGYFG